MKNALGISGWAGNYACHIDELVPGFLGRLQRSDAGRRQIIFAAFSKMPIDSVLKAQEKIPEIADRLIYAKGREVIEKAFRNDPPGFRKALTRCGMAPRPKNLYSQLHAAFSKPEFESLAKVLQFRKKISPRDIKKLRALDPRARDAVILDAIDTVEEAEKLTLQLRLIEQVCSEADDRSLKHSLIAHAKNDEIHYFLEKWLIRADQFPDPPVPATENLVPLQSGSQMSSASNRFRNCLQGLVCYVIAGHSYFYEWQGRQRAIVELRNDKPMGWRVSEVYGIKNSNVSSRTLKEIKQTLTKADIRKRQSWVDSHMLRWCD